MSRGQLYVYLELKIRLETQVWKMDTAVLRGVVERGILKTSS